MIKCKSSNIDYISYDPESKTLEVCFTNGGTYLYSNVTQGAFDAFKDAKSHGQHFHKHVKSAYKFQKKPEKKEEKGE